MSVFLTYPVLRFYFYFKKCNVKSDVNLNSILSSVLGWDVIKTRRSSSCDSSEDR